jgi:hypothetical protein
VHEVVLFYLPTLLLPERDSGVIVFSDTVSQEKKKKKKKDDP